MTSQPKTCPKCSGQQKEDKHLRALNCDIKLVGDIRALDDDVLTLYCEKCGYIGLYPVQRKT